MSSAENPGSGQPGLSSLFAIGTTRPDVAADAWVAPNATVIGDVTLGAQASVWYSAVLRGDGDRIVVGARSNLQDGVVVHADPGVPCQIGDDVTIGHSAVVHGASIHDGCLVGFGSRILNGARIGAGSLIAAGAVVTEGFEAAERSLIVGAPARVRRELTDDEVCDIADNAGDYVVLAQRHRAYARPVDRHGQAPL